MPLFIPQHPRLFKFEQFLLITEVTSKIFRLELERDQICTNLNPCAYFGVRDNTITVFADARKSISNIRFLDHRQLPGSFASSCPQKE